MKNNNSYKLPLALVFSLFFLWAISSNLLPTMIRQLMKTCELNTFEASFTETAYWLAYFIFPIPIAMFMKRYSYKAGIIFGLVLAAAGGLLFFPAAMLKEYWAYLCIFFVIATGMCFLETAANPYVTALGDAATAPQRLNLAQSFNGLGAFIAAMFLSKLILSGTHYTRETLPADYPGGWEAYIQFETDAMKTPYLALAVLLLVIAGIFIFSRLPKIGDEGQRGTSKEKLIDFSVWKRSHLRWGVIAQFFIMADRRYQQPVFSLLLFVCRNFGVGSYHLFRFVYAGFPAGTMDWYRTDDSFPSARYVAGLCIGEYSALCRSCRVWRLDWSVCHAGHFVLHVHHVSYPVFIGTERFGQSDEKWLCFSGDVDSG